MQGLRGNLQPPASGEGHRDSNPRGTTGEAAVSLPHRLLRMPQGQCKANKCKPERGCNKTIRQAKHGSTVKNKTKQFQTGLQTTNKAKAKHGSTANKTNQTKG
ncbi:hypothetical protein AMECASPLE_023606 [Ameca splendens]|uniref:Uncharacterized protein n=1 Tax=Ameca splendens TaxID=208324 RepID=A0ABV0Z251_9TELE